MSFLELLQTQTDKVTLTEMILIKKHLPDRVTRPVPGCMYLETEEGEPAELDYQVFNILCWVMARREAPAISLEDVGDKIGLNDSEGISTIVQEVIFFYSSLTREAITERFSETSEAAEEPENPSPSTTSTET